MEYNADLSYIDLNNYKTLLDRINYIIEHPHTTNHIPSDITQLVEIREYIYRKFFNCA